MRPYAKRFIYYVDTKARLCFFKIQRIGEGDRGLRRTRVGSPANLSCAEQHGTSPPAVSLPFPQFEKYQSMETEAPPTPHRCRPIRPMLWSVDVLQHHFTNPVEIGPVDES